MSRESEDRSDPFEEPELTDAARQRWRERFKTHVEASVNLLERAPEDAAPTPESIDPTRPRVIPV